MSAPLATTVMRRIDALAQISDDPDRLTRTFASPAMRRANRLVGSWMREAGLAVREDAAFNLIGRRNATRRGTKTLLLGSHLDTVRDAGKYDGPLGVLVAIAAVQSLLQRGGTLPFSLEVIGFSDEEGLRYQTPYLGSRALAGTLTAADYARVKEKHIINARRRPGEFLGYAEVHIEQGPVLEQHDLPVGVVTDIAGQNRLHVEFHGVAGHAGTVPMGMRQDALAGSAELVLATEASGITATVGLLRVEGGASNVIPGQVVLTLDARHPDDARRRAAVRSLRAQANGIARRRGLKLVWTPVQQTAAVHCDESLTRVLSQCVARRGLEVIKLASGAGHDAAAMSAICPVAMLFVRCKGGISHHPAESVKTGDVRIAVEVLCDFILHLAGQA